MSKETPESYVILMKDLTGKEYKGSIGKEYEDIGAEYNILIKQIFDDEANEGNKKIGECLAACYLASSAKAYIMDALFETKVAKKDSDKKELTDSEKNQILEQKNQILDYFYRYIENKAKTPIKREALIQDIKQRPTISEGAKGPGLTEKEKQDILTLYSNANDEEINSFYATNIRGSERLREKLEKQHEEFMAPAIEYLQNSAAVQKGAEKILEQSGFSNTSGKWEISHKKQREIDKKVEQHVKAKKGEKPEYKAYLSKHEKIQELADLLNNANPYLSLKQMTKSLDEIKKQSDLYQKRHIFFRFKSEISKVCEKALKEVGNIYDSRYDSRLKK